MIDNVILLITGTLHGRPIHELLPKCHPLGTFDQLAAINLANSSIMLYNAVLVDTPLGRLLLHVILFLIWKDFQSGQPLGCVEKTNKQLFLTIA